MINRSCVLLFAVFCGAAFAGQLTDQVDRFEQKRELKWESSIRSDNPAQMATNATVFFAKDSSPLNGLVYLYGSFESPRYASCHSVKWLADGVPVSPSSNLYRGSPRKGSDRTIEIVTSVFSVAQLREIAHAKLVEYKVCNDEGKVAEEDLAGLRELTDRL